MDIADAGWAAPLIQLATATGYGGLVWYLVVKHIPLIEQRHQSERVEWLNYIRTRDQEVQQIMRDHVQLTNDVQVEVRKLNDYLSK